MKTKVLIILTALILAATSITGATLAYLTAKTEKTTNVFTFGNVSGELKEIWNASDGQNILPGKLISKEPYVKIGSNSAKAFAFLKVTVSDAAAMKKAFGNIAANQVLEKLACKDNATTLNTSIWELKDWAEDTTKDTITYIFSVYNALEPGAESGRLFTHITVPTAIDGSDAYKTVTENGFTIDIQAYFIQYDNVYSADTAYNAIKDMINAAS